MLTEDFRHCFLPCLLLSSVVLPRCYTLCVWWTQFSWFLSNHSLPPSLEVFLRKEGELNVRVRVRVRVRVCDGPALVLEGLDPLI